jgi:hypothetical protein
MKGTLHFIWDVSLRIPEMSLSCRGVIRDRDYKIMMRDVGNMLNCAQGWKAEKLRSQLQFEARDTPKSLFFI